MDGDGYAAGDALLVVDVQNDFADPGGSLHVPGGEEIIAGINAEVARARQAGAPVVYTQDWHPPHTPHFAQDGGIWPVHCVAGTWGAELHPALDRADGAEVLRKGTGGEDGYSAFSVRDPLTGSAGGTGLAELLGGLGVTRLTIVGLATDYCVKETALDARAAGYGVRVLRRAVRAVGLAPGDEDEAISSMREAGTEIL